MKEIRAAIIKQVQAADAEPERAVAEEEALADEKVPAVAL